MADEGKIHMNFVKKTIVNKYVLLVLSCCLLLVLWGCNKSYDVETNESTSVNESIELTKETISNGQYQNKVIHYKGVVGKSFKNKYGIVNVYFENQNLPNTVAVSIFPSLGFDKKIDKGDEIIVYGVVKPYKDILEIEPLNKDSIKILAKNQSNDSVKLKDVSSHIGEYITINNVSIVQQNEFTSKKSGKKHLRFKIIQNGNSYDGIAFEKTYNQYRNLLLGEGNVCLKVKVDTYNQKISLIVNHVSEREIK